METTRRATPPLLLAGPRQLSWPNPFHISVCLGHENVFGVAKVSLFLIKIYSIISLNEELLTITSLSYDQLKKKYLITTSLFECREYYVLQQSFSLTLFMVQPEHLQTIVSNSSNTQHAFVEIAESALVRLTAHLYNQPSRFSIVTKTFQTVDGL